jgi:retron-type reverse transcriptase
VSLGRAVHQKPGETGRSAGGRGEAEPEAGRDEARTARYGTGSLGRDGLLLQALVKANMEAAWKRVKSNRGGAGVDGLSIAETADYLRAHWPRIRESLLDGSYRPCPVRRVQIPKPDGGVRELGIPTVTDRLIQQALLQVLQRKIDPTFSEHSYGFRPGRRAHDAVRQAQRYVQDGYRMVVDVDLEKFFDRVNHDILMERLARRIEDKAVLRLIRRYLVAGILDGGVVMERYEGTPQGGPLSPLLANVLLDEVDRELERRGHRFVRYADDCVPRRRTGGRKPSVQPCCTRDEGGPLGAAVQAEAPNHPLLLPSREVVVSELGKGGAGPCQVRTVESNVSEPLRTCRKRRNGVKTGGESLLRDQSGGHLSTAQMASGMKAARTRSRLLCGTWEPVTPMPRERCKGKPPECLSTDAGYRGGATRSSEEGPVMGLERRGCPIQLETKEQLVTGGLF